MAFLGDSHESKGLSRCGPIRNLVVTIASALQKAGHERSTVYLGGHKALLIRPRSPITVIPKIVFALMPPGWLVNQWRRIRGLE